MVISFDTLPSTAKVWLFQADRVVDTITQEAISKFLVTHIDTWDSHGTPLKAGTAFFYNRILAIGVDTSRNSPSGCSIDTSIAWIKQIYDYFKVDFFDRSLLYFKDDTMKAIPIFEIKKYIVSGEILPETYILNSQISLKGDLSSRWKIRADASIIKRFF
jgi:hypothetical protein